MILFFYFLCGFCYTFYNYNKILENKESFFVVFKQENSKESLKNFIIVLTLLSFLAWPLMMLNEIKNKQDM